VGAGSQGENPWSFAVGGGGAGGSYVFADLAELDGLIAEWTTIRNGVQADGRRLIRAIRLIEPPAKDLMSQFQASALKESLTKAQKHNAAMAAYANSYIEKLRAARAQYAAGDEQNAEQLRRVDGS